MFMPEITTETYYKIILKSAYCADEDGEFYLTININLLLYDDK